MTIKSAFMNLITAKWVNPDRGNLTEMEWALELDQATHGISDLHLKTGVCLADGTIVLVATGHKEEMTAELGGILLHFTVSRPANGEKYKLALKKTQYFFPQIMPRQLD